MLKELFFIKKVKKLNVIHIRQYLERQGFELISMQSDFGQDLREVLKLNFTGEKALVYISEKVKYVFYNPDLNEDDLEHVLLHECGHINLKHKINSMQNEAAAWNFAYTVKNLHKKITKAIALMMVPVLITLLSLNLFLKNEISSAPQMTGISKIAPAPLINDTHPQDKVYITTSGTKFHTKDCMFIRDKKSISCTRAEAEELFLPCSSCIK